MNSCHDTLDITIIIRNIRTLGRGGLRSNYIWYDFKVQDGGCALDAKFIMLD